MSLIKNMYTGGFFTSATLNITVRDTRVLARHWTAYPYTYKVLYINIQREKKTERYICIHIHTHTGIYVYVYENRLYIYIFIYVYGYEKQVTVATSMFRAKLVANGEAGPLSRSKSLRRVRKIIYRATRTGRVQIHALMYGRAGVLSRAVATVVRGYVHVFRVWTSAVHSGWSSLTVSPVVNVATRACSTCILDATHLARGVNFYLCQSLSFNDVPINTYTYIFRKRK